MGHSGGPQLLRINQFGCQEDPRQRAGIIRLYRIDIDVAVGDGVDGEGGDALEAEFVHDVFAVGDDRGEADVEFVGDLFVDEALDNEGHDFDFAVGEDLLLEGLGHGGKVLAMTMGVLFEHQE